MITLLKSLAHFMTSFSRKTKTKEIKKIVQKKTEIVRKIIQKEKWKNEKLYHSYKSLFESVKRKFKRIYYSSKILELKNNTKKTWCVMKGRISKIRNTESSLPKNLLVKKKIT